MGCERISALSEPFLDTDLCYSHSSMQFGKGFCRYEQDAYKSDVERMRVQWLLTIVGR